MKRYADNAARFLLARNVKVLLIACNTASAYAIEELTATVPVHVIGAVEPGARAAVRASRSGSMGVIGTLGTVRSGAYPRAIAKLAGKDVRITARACPLLVPLVEEGWLDGEVPTLVARRYLDELHREAPELDVLVLGCTHYPLLRPLLQQLANERWDRPITLVDSAETMAQETAEILARDGLLANDGAAPALEVCVTDEARIDEVGARFLGHPLVGVQRVDL